MLTLVGARYFVAQLQCGVMGPSEHAITCDLPEAVGWNHNGSGNRLLSSHPSLAILAAPKSLVELEVGIQRLRLGVGRNSRRFTRHYYIWRGSRARRGNLITSRPCLCFRACTSTWP